MNEENNVTLIDSTLNTISEMEKILDDMTENFTKPPYKEEAEPKSYTLELVSNPDRYYNFRIVEATEHYPAHAFVRLHDNGFNQEWHDDVTPANVHEHVDYNDLPSVTAVESVAFSKKSAVELWKVLVDKYGFVEKK
tara:strand:+ start:743 stop:1153 length:411 start_codon:yes stop_codon:yes gene_type:complete